MTYDRTGPRNRTGEPCGAITRRKGKPCKVSRPCPYHGQKVEIDMDEATDLPDPADKEAVNMWLRRLAIQGLARLDAEGGASPQDYNFFRTSLQKLHEEDRNTKPAVKSEDAVDKMRQKLDELD